MHYLNSLQQTLNYYEAKDKYPEYGEDFWLRNTAGDIFNDPLFTINKPCEVGMQIMLAQSIGGGMAQSAFNNWDKPAPENYDYYKNNPVQGPGSSTIKGFEAPEIYTNSKGQMTNGKYIVDSTGMQPHTNGSTTSGKSQFLFDVDANKAILDGAAYADANNLWNNGKATVYI